MEMKLYSKDICQEPIFTFPSKLMKMTISGAISYANKGRNLFLPS